MTIFEVHELDVWQTADGTWEIRSSKPAGRFTLSGSMSPAKVLSALERSEMIDHARDYTAMRLADANGYSIDTKNEGMPVFEVLARK